MKATSDYLNREPRALAEVMQMREPSGSVPEVPYQFRAQPLAWPSSRYGDRTICDIPDEHEEDVPSWVKRRPRATLDRYLTGALIIALAAFAAGQITVIVWDHAYGLTDHQRQIIEQTHGFEGGN